MAADHTCECHVLVRHERELRESWQSAHLAVHKADAESLQIARDDVNRRLGEMNELRTQITTERGEFLRRDLYDREHASLRDALDQRVKTLEQAKSNLDGRLWGIGAAILVVNIIIQFAMRYFTR